MMISGVSGKPLRVEWQSPHGEGRMRGYVVGFVVNGGMPYAIVESGRKLVALSLEDLTVID